MGFEPSRRRVAHWALLGSLVPFFCCAGGRNSLNIALHAQVPPSSKEIVGSAVTMAGVRQALLSKKWTSRVAPPAGENRGSSIAEGPRWNVGNVTIFYPFEYRGLHDRSWDLVIIEGWFAMINSFIHEVRAISHPRPVTTLFYCLDPQYPGLPHVAALDVEGFLTNSESTRQYLLLSAPTALVPLAVDTEEAFPFSPDPPCPGAASSAEPATPNLSEDGSAVIGGGEGGGYGCGRVVYVGAFALLKYKQMLAGMLREAAPYGLDIYGSGWQQSSEFSGYWRGVLPQEDLASVYGRALAVIGVTMDAQRESGKINNRVFEALSVGAPLISDHFPALEATFGDAILYARHPGDVSRHLETLLLSSNAAGWKEAEVNARQRRRAIIEDNHTWAHRVEDILSFVGSLPGNGQDIISPGGEDQRVTSGGGEGAEVPRCLRQRGCLTLAIVIDNDLEGDITLESTFVPAVELLLSTYVVTWWVAPVQWGTGQDPVRPEAGDRMTNGKKKLDTEAKGTHYGQRRRMQLPRDVSCLESYDVVWAAGRWGGLADRTVRGLLRRGGPTSAPRMIRPRLTEQLTGLVLWGPLCTPSSNTTRGVALDGHTDDVGGREEACPEYAGDAGLRWYDVVYCQTRWDYMFLAQQAFEGSTSSNLQQAWGYGTARPSPSNLVLDHNDQGKMAGGTNPVDLLVIGTDAQVTDMLQLFKAPGLTNVALAVIVTPTSTSTTRMAQPELASVLNTAGVVAGEGVDDLPQRLSLFATGSSRDSSLTPLPLEILLVRRVDDVDALAKLASGADNVVVAVKGPLGTWAALVSASETYGGRRAKEEEVGRIVDKGDDGRIRALIKEGPDAWSDSWYSFRLIQGMTRALCLGRGNSRISIVHPVDEDSAGVVVAVDTVVAMRVIVEDFHVGRDGQWCITVQGRTANCVLLNEFVVDLRISSSASESEWESVINTAGLVSGRQQGGTDTKGALIGGRDLLSVEVATELRSNMYRDVLYRSKPFSLFIDPTVSAAPSYGVAGCTHADRSVVHCNQTSPEPVGGIGKPIVSVSLDTKDFFGVGNIVRVTTSPYDSGKASS